MTPAPTGIWRRTAAPRRARRMQGQVSGQQKMIEADTCRPDGGARLGKVAEASGRILRP
jgi:hypothetical protein